MAKFRLFGRRASLVAALAIGTTAMPVDISLAQDSPAYDAALSRVLSRPADAEASFLFAQAAATSGRFREAISALERVLILNPDLANIKLELGVLYLRVGQSALAERFIREALASPDAPAEVRGRAEDLLAIAEQGNDPFAVSHNLTFGVISDSNANSGPSSGVPPEDTGQSDVSAYLRWATRFSYDLGYQSGNSIIGGFDLYTRRYDDQTSLDLNRYGANIGVALNFGAGSDAGSTLRITLDTARIERDGESFVTETGPTLAYSFPASEDSTVELSAFYRDQDFDNTTTVTVNDQRDGELYGFGATLRRSAGENGVLTFGVRAAQKSAQVGFEAYDEYGLSLGYATVRDALFDFGGDKWRFGLTASAARRGYDAPDPIVSATDAEGATNYAVVGSVEIPLENRLSLLAEVGTNGNSSNYGINDFSNTFVSLSVSASF